ncbi:MAG TPA: hypothetical protein VE978_23660 [Chitinophagales bacterium]|nr:hypothetical protein [Chitinophagales bacterium]
MKNFVFKVMMKKNGRIFLLVCIHYSLFTIHSFAQETIRSEEVDIVKAYQPLLADAVKIQLHADPAPIDTTMQPLQYDVKEHVIELPFSPAEIRPIALPQTPPEPTQNNLIKAGFGTQLTPLIELYLGNGRSDKFNYGLSFHHVSSNPSKIDFQDVSHTGAAIFGRSYFKSTELSGEVNYDRQEHYFYGFPSYFVDSLELYDKDFLRQKFQTTGVNVRLKNAKETKAGIDYDFNFNFHDFERRAGDTMIHDVSENYYRFCASLGKTILKIHSANLDFDFQKENLKSNIDSSVSYFSIIPNYQYHSKKAALELGVNVDVVNKEVKLYPELFASYKLIGEYLIPYGGFHGGSNPNTMQQITSVNPFIGNFDSIVTTENIEVFGGIKGSYGNYITYNVRVSYADQKNVPFYLQDGRIPAHFIPFYYYEAKIISAHAEIGYRQSERLNLILSGDANTFNLDFSDKPWGIPQNKVSLAINYNLQNKILFNVDLFAQSGAYAYAIIPGDSVSTQLKGVVDVNFSTTYNYKKNLAFWFSLNNIASVKDRQWYNYPYYGFQALAGAILKF